MSPNFHPVMRRLLFSLILTLPFVARGQLSWFGDTSAQSGQSYTVGASGSYSSITIYKNGAYFASGAYGVGASTSDTGPATISYRADGSGSSGSTTIYRSVSISGPNHAPSASIGGDTSLTLSNGSATGSWSFSASDPDGNLSRWRVSLAPNVARWTTISGSSQSSSFSYTFTSAGTYTFNLDVEDTNGASASDSVTVTVLSAPQRYNLSVISGSGDGSYLANETAYISANSPPSDYEFWHWKKNYGPGSLWYDWQSSTDFAMGAGDAEVEAVYQVITHYLSVINGTGSGYYASGSSVHIVANPAPAGQHFTGWSLDSGHGSFQDASSPDTYFNSSAWDSTVRANYAVTEYSLTVLGGSGSGSYAPGQVVEIRANNAPSGTTFSYWSISGPGSVQQSTSMLTRFTMGSGNATVTAIYDTLYLLTVINGTINGGQGPFSVVSGHNVTLQANSPASGYRFTQWTLSGPGSIASPTSSTSGFTTGTGDATVTANYELLPAPPSIVTPPQSTVTSVGGTVGFSATVAGAPTPTLQWKRDGTVVGSGATLTLSSVQTGDAGSYTLTASNINGSVTSSPATLVVVTTSPQNRTAATGSTVVFSVGIAGPGTATFQWRKGGGNLSDGGTVSGSTTATLTLTAVQPAAAGNYDVMVTNGATSLTTAAATLTVTARDPNADDDHDGVSNGVELALGLNPDDPTDVTVQIFSYDNINQINDDAGGTYIKDEEGNIKEVQPK